MFGGLLVEGVSGWDERTQAIGTEDDFGFLAFPQGGGRVRVYGSYSLDERRRFAGEDGARRFLDAFRMTCSPGNRHIADGRPAGPLRSFFNNDSWTDEPFAPGAVLIGDAAGWNDPIIGLGLSITYRDVRIVSDLLLGSEDWSPGLFAPYAEERAERMRRLRFVAKIQSALDPEFGNDPRERRRGFYARSRSDPSLNMHAFAVMGGPDAAPSETFTEAYWTRVLGTEAPA
jgi:2-polyprenyl-6-methoxyphenol hydroxylase-like FAD-dependent oxidoreductase